MSGEFPWAAYQDWLRTSGRVDSDESVERFMDAQGYAPDTAAPVRVGVMPSGPAPTNGLAIASLVLSLAVPGIGSILAIIFGNIALNQIRERGQQGRGLAIAGIVIGWVVIASVVLIIAAAVIIASIAVSLRG